MSSNGPSGGFSLFPNTNTTKTPPRKTTPVIRVTTPQSLLEEQAASYETSPPRNVAQSPEDLSEYVIDGTPPSLVGRSHSPLPPPPPGPPPVHEQTASRSVRSPEEYPRSETAFSGATVLNRSESTRSRSSIAKRPLEDFRTTSPEHETGLRSIFPQYDHALPLDRQDYFPTQTSPTHIPRTVISRQSHFPRDEDTISPIRSPHTPLRSPPTATSAAARWPQRTHQPEPKIPAVSTTESLRDYWKAANGWKASASEGRTYCLKLMGESDTPIYNLTSTTQPFYHMRFDPTSASAYITLSRHDPSKPCKETDPHANKTPTGILGMLREGEARTWQDVVTTTLEEPSRRLPPEDGLIALIYPCAATKMALDKPGDISVVMTAERECARLVWDEDSQNHFLVHPALATPFCITIERNPSWSRTEYTLEHIESQRHMAKLTRTGTGEGWMELDTLVAGQIESFYILDVVVCALMIVANADEKNNARLDQFFEPPPPVHMRASSKLSNHGSLLSKMSGLKEEKPAAKKKRGKMEELELDLESQSSLGGKIDKKEIDKLPTTARVILKLIGFAFKCFIWMVTLAFKILYAVVIGLSKCVGGGK